MKVPNLAKAIFASFNKKAQLDPKAKLVIDFVIQGYGLWHEYLKVGSAKEDDPAPIDEIQSAFCLLENLFYCDLWIKHALSGNPEAHRVIRRLQQQLRKEYPIL